MITILLVDDEPLVRLAVKSLVNWNKNGFHVKYEASNGKQALQIMEQHQDVDIIITDISMPVMDGLTFISRLRERHISAPVLVLSSYQDYPLVRKAFKLGVRDYVLKTEMKPEPFLNLVKSLVPADSIKSGMPGKNQFERALEINGLFRELITEECCCIRRMFGYRSEIMRYISFFKIIFPLLLPATATLAIIKSVDILNDMYIPYLYMPSPTLRTLTTTLMAFSSSKFASWENLSAAIVLIMLPTAVIYILFQRFIFAGIVAGAVKE